MDRCTGVVIVSILCLRCIRWAIRDVSNKLDDRFNSLFEMHKKGKALMVDLQKKEFQFSV